MIKSQRGIIPQELRNSAGMFVVDQERRLLRRTGIEHDVDLGTRHRRFGAHFDLLERFQLLNDLTVINKTRRGGSPQLKKAWPRNRHHQFCISRLLLRIASVGRVIVPFSEVYHWAEAATGE